MKKIISGIVLLILAISIGLNAYYIPKSYDLKNDKKNCEEQIESYSKKDKKKESTNENNNSKEEVKTTEENNYSTKGLINVDLKGIEKYSKDRKIIVVMGRQGCYWCSLYVPIISKITKENKIDLYYYDFNKLVDFSSSTATLTDPEEYNALINWIEDNDYEEAIEEGIGTPMTFFVKDNKIVNLINGYQDEKDLSTTLREEGFIK